MLHYVEDLDNISKKKFEIILDREPFLKKNQISPQEKTFVRKYLTILNKIIKKIMSIDKKIPRINYYSLSSSKIIELEIKQRLQFKSYFYNISIANLSRNISNLSQNLNIN
jgi:hypothetical protein